MKSAQTVKEAQILYDARGRKKQVLLPYETYTRLLEYLNDAYDNRKMGEVEKQERVRCREARLGIVRSKS